jgi:tetratricopeptide (TPR) repeat protein
MSNQSATARAARPHALFFRNTVADMAPFLLAHVREQQRTFEQYFDVTVIDRDCDYDEVCDRVRPDLAIFESGVYSSPRSVTNVHRHPEVPKLGFLHADAFDPFRTAYLADMDRFGIEWTFTTSMSMPEYLPEIADRLFVWPNFVDTSAFRDYSVEKQTDILLTGGRASHYPWRNAVSDALRSSARFRVESTPHHGWHNSPETRAMTTGEAYARSLNSSLLIPTCGSMARDVVRKHLEIPASMSCLLTERTSTIEALGFRDMVNCVFTDADDVVDHVEYLLANRDILHRITTAGFELVRAHHTTAHRDQPAQWLRLIREYGSDIDIVQDWPDGRLRIARPADERHQHLVANGRDRELIAHAWSLNQNGRLAEAAAAAKEALTYYFIPEAAVALAHVQLRQGESRSAQNLIRRILAATFGHRHSHQPDPVAWAYEVRGLLCKGDVAGAITALERYPRLAHEELDRIRLAASLVSKTDLRVASHQPAQHTVSPIPAVSLDTWMSEFAESVRYRGRPDVRASYGDFARDTGAVLGHRATTVAFRVQRRVAERRLEARLRNWRAGRSRGVVMTKLRAAASALLRRLWRR